MASYGSRNGPEDLRIAAGEPGGAAVVWEHERTGTWSRVRRAGVWREIRQLGPARESTFPVLPIASSADGTFAVVREDANGLLLYRAAPREDFGTPVRVAAARPPQGRDPGDTVGNPGLGLAGATALVGWGRSEYGGFDALTTTVFAAVATDGAVSPLLSVPETQNTWGAAAAGNRSGEGLLVWQREDTGGRGVYATRRRADGGVDAPQLVLRGPVSGDATAPSVAMAENGTAAVARTATCNNGALRTFVAFRPAGATQLQRVNLLNPYSTLLAAFAVLDNHAIALVRAPGPLSTIARIPQVRSWEFPTVEAGRMAIRSSAIAS